MLQSLHQVEPKERWCWFFLTLMTSVNWSMDSIDYSSNSLLNFLKSFHEYAHTLYLKLPNFCSWEKTLLWARCFPYLLQSNKFFILKLFGLVVSFGLRATKRETRFEVTGFTHWHSLVSLKGPLFLIFYFSFLHLVIFFLLNLLVQIPKRGNLAGSANFNGVLSHWWRSCWRLIVRLGAMFWKHLAGTSPVRGMVLDKD